MERWLQRTLAALAALAVLVWAVLAALRVPWPFELEWQEGGMLAHAGRVLAGERLYAEPSLEFMAFPYPPLYAWTSAAAAAVVGEGFLALRLVSALSTLALLALVAAYTARETGRRWTGLVAAGVYAAGFRYAGAWFDVARVDALALALATAALYVARFRPRARGAAAAGVLAALAFLAKQTTLGITAPLALALLGRGVRPALAFSAALAGVAGSAVLALHSASDGWSTFYAFGLLRGHGTYAPKVLGFWTEDVVLLAPAALAALAGRAPRAVRPRRPFLLWPVLGMLGVAWVGRAHQGGYDNTLLPALLAAALLAGRASGSAAERGGAVARGVFALLVVQLALLAYDPRAHVPSRADAEAAERVIVELAAVEGEVFAPHQGYLAERAGKGWSVHAMAVVDLLESRGNEKAARRFVGRLERALADRRFAVLLMGEPWEHLDALHHHYRLERRLFPPDDGRMVPVTGAPVRPELWYVPR